MIGDIHGHLDRFEALMVEAGLLDLCEACSEDAFKATDEICEVCDGDGVVRVERDTVEVVLIGDVGDFSKQGSPTADNLTYHFADKWADVILWGNHDYACFGGPSFTEYLPPSWETRKIMCKLYGEGRLKLAHEAHGWLLTHAGLHAAFKHQHGAPDEVKEDPAAFVEWIERVNVIVPSEGDLDPQAVAVRDAVPRIRNGRAPAGGILWRHVTEKLYRPFPQVFGHSANHKTRQVRHLGERNWCIDIGGIGREGGFDEGDCLAGIWLPTEEIVKVTL